MRVHTGSRSKKRKNPIHSRKFSQLGLSKWVKSIEYIMVASSLFWAAGAAAGCQEDLTSKLSPPPATRKPAAYVNTQAYPIYSLDNEAPLPGNSLPKEHMILSSKFLANEKVFTGSALSGSFRQNPYYTPTSVRIFNFNFK